MTVYYLINELKVAAQSAQNGVYSSLYFEEMASRLGVTAEKLPVSQVTETAFNATDVVLVGAETLAADVVGALQTATANGALVIGFATQGADDLFGLTVKGKVTQTEPYETIGQFVAPQMVLPSRVDMPLPIMSDVLVTAGGKVQATIQVGDQLVQGLVAGDNTYYIPFDLPHTLLKIVQGKSNPEGPSGYFPVGRIPDRRSLGYDFDSTNPVADLYLLLLEKLLWNRKIPMVHVLPTLKDGVTPADILFFYGGDDDNTCGELDERASQIMFAKGLPYHLNMMPEGEHGGYRLDRAGMEKILARGHELALHYNLTGVPFTKESFAQQMGTYVEAYQDVPVSNVGHCLANVGYSEFARWQAELGVKGDAGMVGTINQADINAFNVYDFGFGTAYPFFIYDDADHQSKRLDFCGIPLAYYEPRTGGQYGESDAQLRKCAENAAYYAQPVCLFSHPHYVAFWQGYDSTMTLRAFDTIHGICAQNGWQVVHTGPDELCLWWIERDAAKLTQTETGLTVSLAGDRPMVIKIPLTSEAPAVTVDGVSTSVTTKTIGGLDYALVVVSGKGEHTITY
ncbi:MAG: hypothetical protein IKU10_02140 [Clostridia bacterium]|nr:hypothetical protein [Clostridia bacterium]